MINVIQNMIEKQLKTITIKDDPDKEQKKR